MTAQLTSFLRARLGTFLRLLKPRSRKEVLMPMRVLSSIPMMEL